MSADQKNAPYDFPENSRELIAQVTTPSIETDTEPAPGTAARGSPGGGVQPYDPYVASKDLGGTCPHCNGKMETFVRASYEGPDEVSLKLFGQCLRSCGYRPSGTLETAGVTGGI